ncbi:DUF6503 family protein [Rubricoccus marinus]|uniref:Deoxyribose-phosphate aldolase n=1 Tax=Rubricoccus marinus TaxID=716817 RepID=A0A259U0X1_9BACT|nr:DUF6503 family protein [Rubricoccus marinus]OZC03590.1 hypothetical protein BSZ36_11715 [Rubricoccus marinus]
MRTLLALALAAALTACSDAPARGPSGDAEAVALVRAAQQAHGSDNLEGATLHFTFRGDAFTARRDGGRFRYTRTTRDEQAREVVDVLDNSGLSRTVGGEAVRLAPEEIGPITTAVNSVVYFATLPAALSDAAVQARSLGRDSVAGEPYDRLEVTFAQEGGGNDWEDRYLYWLHPERRTLDYIAYSYRVAPGASGANDTGHRFRRVIGTADAGGFRVQDYANLTADSLSALEEYPAALARGVTREVSEVRTEQARLER